MVKIMYVKSCLVRREHSISGTSVTKMALDPDPPLRTSPALSSPSAWC